MVILVLDHGPAAGLGITMYVRYNTNYAKGAPPYANIRTEGIQKNQILQSESKNITWFWRDQLLEQTGHAYISSAC